MDKRQIKNIALSIGRDLLLAFVVVVFIMLALYAYCGIWPPMVVVESGSMQHSDTTSYIGVIDTGDMVFVKRANKKNDLLTYVEGEAIDYSTYGAFGDVVIYRPNGNLSRVPIIHRLVVWIEANDSLASPPVNDSVDYDNYTFDISSLGIHGSIEDVILHDYGYEHKNVTIQLTSLLESYKIGKITPHDGFITMGDNNPNYDQPNYEPVEVEWIIGKAIGELPWFGLIKLSVTGDVGNTAPRNSWVNLFALLVVLVCIPIFLDFGLPLIKKKLRAVNDKGEDDEKAISNTAQTVTSNIEIQASEKIDTECILAKDETKISGK